HECADVQALLGAEPGGHAGGAEALGQRGGVELLHVRWLLDPARAEEAHSSPAVSSRPSMRFRSCTACPAAPFQRLSIAANTRTRPVAGSTVAWMRHMLVSRTSRTPGGESASSTKGSSA